MYYQLRHTDSYFVEQLVCLCMFDCPGMQCHLPVIEHYTAAYACYIVYSRHELL